MSAFLPIPYWVGCGWQRAELQRVAFCQGTRTCAQLWFQLSVAVRWPLRECHPLRMLRLRPDSRTAGKMPSEPPHRWPVPRPWSRPTGTLWVGGLAFPAGTACLSVACCAVCGASRRDGAWQASNSPLPCYAGLAIGFIIAAVGSTRGIKQRVFFVYV